MGWGAQERRGQHRQAGREPRRRSREVELPDFPASEELTKLNEGLSERLPKPSEVVEANFELTSPAPTAQRDLTLRRSRPVAARLVARRRPRSRQEDREEGLTFCVVRLRGPTVDEPRRRVGTVGCALTAKRI